MGGGADCVSSINKMRTGSNGSAGKQPRPSRGANWRLFRVFSVRLQTFLTEFFFSFYSDPFGSFRPKYDSVRCHINHRAY